LDKFLEQHKLTKLSEEEIDNMNYATSIKGIEFLDKKKIPTKKTLGVLVTLMNFTKCVRKKQFQIYAKVSSK
jgi:hypothetical protein